ncbi:MAG: Eco57I restriction-modification methylase domain-containing protein, partial [Candidatus Thermoplasmatota archaeon]
YNGGLFRQADPTTGTKEFLATKRVGDADMAEAIDLLARGAGQTQGEGFVDYTSLEAQQLGTLYEGLLEYQVGYAAAEDHVAAGEGERWIPESQHTGAKVTDLARRAPVGTFFLQTDKGERHSTGSYYTPDFIVQEIVQKTITPVLERRLTTAREHGKSLRETVLHFRVLDPAMGSGHFLVGVVDYLTPKLIEAVEEDKAAGRMPAEAHYSTEDARRDIVSHCVYGVDLNPMAVELAKVTLWLHTLARGKPLTFLDHRLKVGNSLLGANVRRLSRYPAPEIQERWAGEVAAAREERAEQRFEEAGFPTLFLEKITGRIAKIDALRDDKIEDVKQKEKIYRELRASPEFQKIRAICDIWSAAWFGTWATLDPVKGVGGNYTDLMWALSGRMSDDEWGWKSRRANLEGIRKLAKRKGFFHWEFEFPEVFFPDGQLRDDAGFDAVVGNPPYLNIETLYSADPEAPPVFEKLYETAGEGRYDIYVMFVERGLEKLRPDGEFGYIMPNKWFKGEFGRPLRSLLARQKHVREITDWRNYYTLFPGAITFVALLYLSRLKQEQFRYVAFPSLIATTPVEVAERRLREASHQEAVRGKDIIVGEIPASRFSAKPWNFATGDAHELLARLKVLPHLGSIADVFEGVTTASVPVYVLQRGAHDASRGSVRAWSDAIEGYVELEAGIVRPVLKGKDIYRWRRFYDEDIILWPYRPAKGRSGSDSFELLPRETMEREYPKAWAYLNDSRVRTVLESREPDKKTGVGRFAGKADWYAFSYPKSMTRFGTPKVVLPDAASQGDAAWDPIGAVVVDTAYGVVPASGSKWNIFAIQALLNNHLLTFFVREMGSPLKDGFYRFKTRYVEPFPVPEVSWPADDQHEHGVYGEIVSAIEAGRPADTLLALVESSVNESRLDIVHDILAEMGRRLNEHHEVNLTETKAFLRWFQRTFMLPEARFDDFAGKTKLQRYAEFSLDEILEVARKNKKYLRVKPTERAFQEEFEREFNASVAKQRPRFEAARRLEPVVEEIVYRMYGLTAEERAVVEEAAAAIQYK